jgi:hypothetical protein
MSPLMTPNAIQGAPPRVAKPGIMGWNGVIVTQREQLPVLERKAKPIFHEPMARNFDWIIDSDDLQHWDTEFA